MMDDLFRTQYANAQTAYARRQQGLPPAELPPATVAYQLHPAGQQAPRDQYNFQPVGNGAWRIYPPGVQAPAHGPQGSHPQMPTDYTDLQRLGNDLHRQTRQPGPAGGIAGII